jgi:pSer/pThr/pTyr-binding forkhead associated (FHA) protein
MPIKPHNSHILIIEDDTGRREFILDAPSYSIGRDPNCDLRLISQFVSRHHATLIQEQETGEDGEFRYQIVDGDRKGKPSANGLLINGAKVQSHILKNEDKIVFGPRVQAIYYLLRRDAIATIPPDEFDITLISPNMIEDLDEDFEDSDEDFEDFDGDFNKNFDEDLEEDFTNVFDEDPDED